MIYKHWTTIIDGAESETTLTLSTAERLAPYFFEPTDQRISLGRESAARLWEDLKHFAETGLPPGGLPEGLVAPQSDH